MARGVQNATLRVASVLRAVSYQTEPARLDSSRTFSTIADQDCADHGGRQQVAARSGVR